MQVRFLLGAPGRGGRVVEGAALEKLYGGNLIVGSNPTLSAFYTCSLSSMERVAVSGTADVSSILTGSTKTI
jgi:hypothetical protein